jgi:hypothetical protein
MVALPGWSPLSVVEDRQSHTVFSIAAPYSEGTYHFLVNWDEDRDPRVLGAVLALYYKHPKLFECVISWSESKARLDVQIVRKMILIPLPTGHKMVSDSDLELGRKLREIVSTNAFAIEHDSWEVEINQIAWPVGPGHHMAEVHRLHKLGLQRPPSISDEIQTVPGEAVTVTYATAAKLRKPGGIPGRLPQAQFLTLEEAMCASFPEGAELARIPVQGGYLFKQSHSQWEFARD